MHMLPLTDRYVAFIPAFSFARVDDFTWGNRDSEVVVGGGAAAESLQRIQANKRRYRNVKIKINLLFIALNGLLLPAYIALAHNVGHPAWFFGLYLCLVFVPMFVQLAFAGLFVLRALLRWVFGVFRNMIHELGDQENDRLHASAAGDMDVDARYGGSHRDQLQQQLNAVPGGVPQLLRSLSVLDRVPSHAANPGLGGGTGAASHQGVSGENSTSTSASIVQPSPGVAQGGGRILAPPIPPGAFAAGLSARASAVATDLHLPTMSAATTPTATPATSPADGLTTLSSLVRHHHIDGMSPVPLPSTSGSTNVTNIIVVSGPPRPNRGASGHGSSRRAIEYVSDEDA